MPENGMLRSRWRGLETGAMDGIGSHFTTERVKIGHSRPTAVRARPRPYRKHRRILVLITSGPGGAGSSSF